MEVAFFILRQDLLGVEAFWSYRKITICVSVRTEMALRKVDHFGTQIGYTPMD